MSEIGSAKGATKKLDGGREGRDTRDDYAETIATHDEPQNVDDGREEHDQSDDRVEAIASTRALKNRRTFLANRRSAREALAHGSIEKGRYTLRNAPHKSRRSDNESATDADRFGVKKMMARPERFERPTLRFVV